MLIFSEHITQRLQYVVRFVFEEFLGIHADITSDKEFFVKADVPKLSYLSHRVNNEFNIYPDSLLFETGIIDKHPELRTWNDLPVIFSGKGLSDMPFDVFAAVFFLLTRYEEYHPFIPDRYGRFPATKSVSFKNAFLERAIIDRWIIAFFSRFKKKYPELKSNERNFTFIPTIDVDSQYAYLHKGLFRCLGGALNSIIRLDFSKLKERLEVLSLKRPDPFYTFARIREIHSDHNLITFFLTAGYGKYDKGIYPGKKAFSELVSEVSEFSHLGLHPSWKSNKKNIILEKELRTLENISGKQITRSRQHYLKIALPDTYNKLADLGITGDYSMGYASHPGFRAGTCTPFLFYDLLNERETTIRIYPFQVMDRTLKDYLCLSPTEAVHKISELITEVREVNGTFISIWHNDAFSDSGEWEEWLEVYKKLLELAGR